MENFHYSFDVAVSECAKRRMHFNHHMANMADDVFYRCNLTQAQVDKILVLWCDLMQYCFNPKTYNPIGRIALAFHFLFGRMK